MSRHHHMFCPRVVASILPVVLSIAAAFAAPDFIESASAPRPFDGGVLFTFEAPDASQVYLAGDFNNWGNNRAGVVSDPTAAMAQAAANNIWSKVVELPTGRAAYKFVVADGQGNCKWFTDPFVLQTDESGNSVYDPSNLASTTPLWSSTAIRVFANERGGGITISFLQAGGGVLQSIALPPIVMDGAEQVDLRPDPDRPGSLVNAGMWLKVEAAGARSVSIAYGAHDAGVHEWTMRVPGNDSYYGGGERFHSLNQKGYLLPMRSLDHPGEKGTASYKPVPFMMSTRGFGIWIDSFAPGVFDLNATTRDLCIFQYKDDVLRAVFIAGPRFGEMLEEYTALTGRPPVPPSWSFAPWKSRNVHFNREEILEDVEKYREYDLPGSVLVIDSPWERGYNDFVLNDEQFSDPRSMFARVEELGFYPCLWLTPFVNKVNVQDMQGIDKGPTSNYQEAADRGYLVKNSKGEVMLANWWKGEGGLVDFTNPAAAEWWMNQLDKAKEWGVKAWKCDDGEGTFVRDAVFHDGSRADEMKGRYAYLYLETMQRHIEERLDGDGVLFARPGFAGTQKFPYCWAGDNHAGWEFDNGLPGVIRAGQTAALSGISMWGHDIAGYHGTQTPELFNRWTEFACFSPLMQLHMTSNLGPWSFGDESLAIYRRYAKLHTQLFPYIHAAAEEAHATGMPIIRPMILAFQDDPIASKEEFQYMFGEDFLVAPIYQPGTRRSVYLPKGVAWVDYWKGDILDGGRYVEVDAPMDRIPLYVRAGSIIPMIPADTDTLVPRSEAMAKDVVTMDSRRILQAWPGADLRFEMDGMTMESRQEAGGTLTLSVTSKVERPLQVYVMHRRMHEGEAGRGDAPDSIVWSDVAMATVLTWDRLVGESGASLRPD